MQAISVVPFWQPWSALTSPASLSGLTSVWEHSAGNQGLEDKRPGPNHAWNRVPEDVQTRIIDLVLDRPELAPRELAVTFTDTQDYFVSESSAYRLLKAHDLITSPAFIVIKAPVSSGIKQQPSTSCGKQTSPI
ncbi:MAG: helix-turn-helix domain-containing protein [Hyphomicrobiales bacterium]|nr:helix-turn-helix domain-containing protein [Hyphomicrobiales bacterium]